MDYGVTNRIGKPHQNEVKKILNYCRDHHIHSIDTAANYGESEKLLGEIIPDSHFKIYTKIPHLDVEMIDDRQLELVERTFFASLRKLKRQNIEGIFIHNAENLQVKNGEKLYQLLRKWQYLGLVKKIGVSIYDHQRIEFLLTHYDIDIFQVPINIYNQRFLQSGILTKLKDRNAEIHARSIFLQGVLLADVKQLPPHLRSLFPIHRQLESFLTDQKLTKIEGALKFISQIKQVDYALVGVNNFKQIKEIVRSYNNLGNHSLNFNDFQVHNLNLIDPRRW